MPALRTRVEARVRADPPALPAPPAVVALAWETGKISWEIPPTISRWEMQPTDNFQVGNATHRRFPAGKFPSWIFDFQTSRWLISHLPVQKTLGVSCYRRRVSTAL